MNVEWNHRYGTIKFGVVCQHLYILALIHRQLLYMYVTASQCICCVDQCVSDIQNFGSGLYYRDEAFILLIIIVLLIKMSVDLELYRCTYCVGLQLRRAPKWSW